MYLVSAVQPDSGIVGVNAFKAYNRQILEIVLRAQTLPDVSGNIAEPYPPIIELRRFLKLAQPLLPDRFIRHKEKRPSAFPLYEEYVFIIDVEDIQIKYFENDSAFYGLGGPSLGAGVGATFEYDFQIWDSEDVVTRPNPNNLLYPRTDIGYLTLNEITSINAQFKNTNDITLAAFTELLARRPLTNKPLRSVVCLSDNEFISFLAANLGGNAIQIDTFDENGTPIDRGIVDILTVTSPIPDVIRFGAGPININAIPPAWWFSVSGTPPFPVTGAPTVNPNVRYYEVSYGFFDAANFGLISNFLVSPSIPFRFYVKRTCCNPRYRVHFLNQYGAGDVVTFRDNEVIEYNTKDEFFERNLPTVFSPQDRTRIQLIKRAEHVLTLTKNNLKKNEVEWLREMLLSPNVFIEIDGQFLPYNIVSGNNTIIDSEASNNEIEIDLISSSEDYSQRN